ncbi:MAG: undecaprenyl/decaprenyl-phosphate alpha-N-acetylglucosaminyl 1-phosphate transferase [Peptococcaceae bacterium]|nr:undecaprenyl/decaprenyl-phosphate alpha-N-acetylglucosaminyl 1-phosphate transferase [Peptococcaceae bacterium]
MVYTVYIIPFIIALLCSCMVTPVSIWLARKWGVLDEPGDRRVHVKAVPRLGGVAIYASFWAVMFLVWELGLLPDTLPNMAWPPQMIWGLFWGSSLIFLVGLVDDIWDIHPLIKLVLQTVAACVPLFFGLELSSVTLPFLGEVVLGNWGSILAVVWIVLIVNTVNITDGLDGLASGICIIASVILAWSALTIEQNIAAQALIVLAAAALGFLFFNYHPAKVFMGDSGSMFLGYILGAMSILGTLKTPVVLGLVFPLLVLGVPFVDILFAVVRRKWQGTPIMKADRGHLHHRLMDSGLSHAQAVWTMYLISLGFGMMAICLNYGMWWVAVVLLVLNSFVIVRIMLRQFPSRVGALGVLARIWHKPDLVDDKRLGRTGAQRYKELEELGEEQERLRDESLSDERERSREERE